MMILMVLMLAADPGTTVPKKPSAVERAMFKIENDGFTRVKSNDALKAVLAGKPYLDAYETAALGSAAQLRAFLGDDPSLVNKRNHFGWTALHFAAFAGNVETAKLLLDSGADINARAGSKFRNTPLQAALLTGEYDTAKLLLERGADVLVRQSQGFAPIHLAAESGRIDLVQLLLDHGAELNSRSDDGRTAYSEALRRNHSDVAEFLKSKGATVEALTADKSKSPD